MTERSHPYTRTHPFMASIKERYNLCAAGSEKETWHVVLDLSDADFPYVVGDSIGVYSPNDAQLVDKTLQAMKLTGEESVISRRTEQSSSLRDYLLKKASVTGFSRKLLADIQERQTNAAKKAHLEMISQDKDALKTYMGERELWDLLLEHEEVSFTAQEYCDVLMPNLPRLYSIASSQSAHPEEVHLTIGLTHYETNGHQRYGVCSHYLCNLAPLHTPEIPIYLHPHNGFTLPLNAAAPIIMVGPGTGVAPFRAFMQERIAGRSKGRNWLFFGERTSQHEFYYRDEWKNQVADGSLRLETAFSRDQAHKIYVQDRMLEHAAEIFSWLEKGAYFYVCGDMAHMAKDVDAMLHRIIAEQGNVDAKQYVKNLRLSKHYLRDVY